MTSVACMLNGDPEIIQVVQVCQGAAHICEWLFGVRFELVAGPSLTHALSPSIGRSIDRSIRRALNLLGSEDKHDIVVLKGEVGRRVAERIEGRCPLE